MSLLKTPEGRHYLLSIISDYFNKFHLSDVEKLLENLKAKENLVLRIDAMELLDLYPWISSYLLYNAIELLKIFNSSLLKLMYEIKTNKNLDKSIDNKCIVRITSLPPGCDDLVRTSIPRSSDVGKFLTISATVVRVGPVQILEYQREFSCNKCKNSVIVEFNESDADFIIMPPKLCTNNDCFSKNFRQVFTDDASEYTGNTKVGKHYKNRQEVQVQEQIKNLQFGKMPRSIRVLLDDDLVDSVKPGDDVIVNGSVLRRWKRLKQGDECSVTLIVIANEVQVTNEASFSSTFHESGNLIDQDSHQQFQSYWHRHRIQGKPWTARNHIVLGMCPLIYGMYYLKLALAILLCGGSKDCRGATADSRSNIRAESHMLLVGDPGTAKSQVLKFAAKLMPRSVLTTGVGSSTAGLTVSAVRTEQGWTLEAGALVLADGGGLCCIDEFGLLPVSDRPAVHEAMEQQTLSVAKAGLICRLGTRCSVIAAANSKAGQYDSTRSLACNTAIATPLLSRFDLIFILQDKCNENWDKAVSDFILKDRIEKQPLNNNALQNPGNSFNPISKRNTEINFDIDRLRQYLSIVKTTMFPSIICDEAAKILELYYGIMRRKHDMNSAYYASSDFDDAEPVAPITMRFLESLIRLAQGHARLMMRPNDTHTVQLEDAIVAIAVMESTAYGPVILTDSTRIKSEFPSDPELEYACLEAEILSKLKFIKKSTKPAANQVPFCDKNESPYQLSSKPVVMRGNNQKRMIHTQINQTTSNTQQFRQFITQPPVNQISSQFATKRNRNTEIKLSESLLDDDSDDENEPYNEEPYVKLQKQVVEEEISSIMNVSIDHARRAQNSSIRSNDNSSSIIGASSSRITSNSRADESVFMSVFDNQQLVTDDDFEL